MASILLRYSASTQFATAADPAIVVAAAGTLSNLNLTLTGSPGTGKNYSATLVLNGVDTGLGVSVADAATTATDTTHSVSVVEGDQISLKLVPTGTPTARSPKWCLTFTPTTDGECIFGLGTNLSPSATATNYEQPLGVGAYSWATTEANRNNAIPGAYTIKRMYVSLGTAPGGATSYTFAMRVAGSISAISKQISGTETTGNVSTDVPIAQGQQLSFTSIPSSVPASSSGIHMGFALAPYVASGGGGGGAGTKDANFFAFF